MVKNTRFSCGEKIVIQLIESMDFTGAAKFTLDFVENEALSFCRLRTVKILADLPIFRVSEGPAEVAKVERVG